MMLTNATITVYNRGYDPLTRFDTWHRTVIENVHVYVDHKASVGDSGLKVNVVNGAIKSWSTRTQNF